MGIFGDVFGGDAAKDAAQRQINALQAGRTAARGDINTGQAQATATFGQGAAPLQQNYATTSAGAEQLAKLLGIGGTSGDIQATLAKIPGYQFTINQGIENIDRNQAAKGALNSGNTDVAIADYVNGKAQQNYQDYVGDLLPFLTGSINTGGQLSGLYQNLGNLQNTNANTLANIDYGTEAGIGNAQANSRLAQGQAGANAINAGMQGINLATSLFGMI